jgi:ubiquinone/menaquinone biosynthesis C-methylase UbiE
VTEPVDVVDLNSAALSGACGFDSHPGHVIDKYERAALRYDRFIGPLVVGARETALEMFPPRDGMRVLDVGCGTGAQLAAYASAGCEVSCVDLSLGMLEVARRRLGPRADVREANGTELPFPDDAFDLATISFVLHEIPVEDRQLVLREMKRVVRPGGAIIVIDFLAGPYGLRGFFARALIVAIEIAAGRDHWRNHRDFLRRGAVQALAGRYGLSIKDERHGGGGTLGVTLLGR